MITLETLINKTFLFLWEPSDLSWTNATETVIPKINDVVRRICNWRLYNILENRMIQGSYLPFWISTKTYDILNDRTTTQEIVVWDTSIYFDTTDYPNSGKIIIWEYIYDYTAKTATYVTISASELDWDAWQTIRLLYDLPIDIDEVTTIRQWVYEIPFVNEANQVTVYNYFSVIDWLLYIKWVTGRVTMKYKTKPVDMSSISDLCIIPEWADMIALISAGEILYSIEEVQDANTKLVQWYAQLREFYARYASQVKKQRTIMSQPFNLTTTYARSTYKNR